MAPPNVVLPLVVSAKAPLMLPAKATPASPDTVASAVITTGRCSAAAPAWAFTAAPSRIVPLFACNVTPLPSTAALTTRLPVVVIDAAPVPALTAPPMVRPPAPSTIVRPLALNAPRVAIALENWRAWSRPSTNR